MKMKVLIVGTGVSGLHTACQLSFLQPNIEILLVTKASVHDSNSSKAQGGISIAHDNSKSLESHVIDTYIAGDRVTNPDRIRDIIKDATLVLDQLKFYGLQFDTDDFGNLHFTLEGGHSEKRIIHIKDFTGQAVTSAMIQCAKSRENITILENYTATELFTIENEKGAPECGGAWFMNNSTGERELLQADFTVLTTGGIGSLYSQSTNGIESNGDGIYMARQVGVPVENMEFVQFHPTGLYQNSGTVPLISEAVRGEGGILRNAENERFMIKYDLRLELAPRDTVARAIAMELNRSNEKCVFLDCTHFEPGFFAKRFPEIYATCKRMGIDPTREMIPVVPVQHFLCGGIQTDNHGRTSLKRLFAAGECACTGLHGANRLASNSLLECLVVSNRVAHLIANSDLNPVRHSSDLIEKEQFSVCEDTTNLGKIEIELSELLSNEVGVLRTTNGLNCALESLNALSERLKREQRTHGHSWEYHRLYRKIYVAKEIAIAASRRRENLGGHYNVDNAGISGNIQLKEDHGDIFV